MKKIVLFFVFFIVTVSITQGQSITISPDAASLASDAALYPLELKGAENNGIYGGRYNGTSVNPTVPLSGDVLFSLSAGGWFGSGYDYTNAWVKFNATENWTSANSGTSISFGTTPLGSYLPLSRMIIYSNGNVGIGSQSIPNAKLEVDGFTKLGLNAPKIKTLKLTGTTASTQGAYATPIPHGLNIDKILDIEVIVKPNTAFRLIRGWRASAGFEFDFYFDANTVQVYNVHNNSGNILNKPLSVFITYEE